eukprot:TRINITY_DN9479_c0_g1_i1.p1 TRINITY_DN9479_c0_g1~~TRINITY_DN9479_c0_g1_i1.p1  ORF type:complete len:59 (-),score=3.31 TRINITY_DN9479_c0_g1_i1:23-199(-)
MLKRNINSLVKSSMPNSVYGSYFENSRLDDCHDCGFWSTDCVIGTWVEVYAAWSTQQL